MPRLIEQIKRLQSRTIKLTVTYKEHYYNILIIQRLWGSPLPTPTHIFATDEDSYATTGPYGYQILQRY